MVPLTPRAGVLYDTVGEVLKGLHRPRRGCGSHDLPEELPHPAGSPHYRWQGEARIIAMSCTEPSTDPDIGIINEHKDPADHRGCLRFPLRPPW